MEKHYRTSERDRPRDTIPQNLKDLVQRELGEYEQVYWLGMPTPSYFNANSKALFFFAIPWTAFAIFWMCGAAGFKMPDFSSGFELFPLFGLPFVLIGIGMLLSPFWEFKKGKNTIYAITNNRALIIEDRNSTTIRSYRPESLQDSYRIEHRDGSGTIIFGKAEKEIEKNDQLLPKGFMHVQNPRQVEKLIKELSES